MSIPTLFIGVGGMGENLVRRIRIKILRMHEAHGDFRQEMYHYVVLDPVCNIPPDKTSDPKDGFLKPDFFVMSGFDNSEYRSFLQHPRFSDFRLRARTGYRVKPPAEIGYNGVRWNGGFGLKLSSDEGKPVNLGQDLTQYLGSALDKVTRFNPGIKATTHSASIIVCGSMCGGTGSGAMLDLGYLIRKIAMDKGFKPNLLGVFGLPDIMSDFVPSNLLYANAYAFLRELNWYMVEPDPRAAQTGLRRFHYMAKFGPYEIDESDQIQNEEHPYDLGIFLSKQSEEGNSIDRADTVLDMAAESLYLLVAGSGSMQFVPNVLTGIKNRHTKNNANQVRSITFGGLGSYTLRFPAHEVKNYLTALAAPPLLGDYVISPAGAGEKGHQRYQELLQKDTPAFRLDKVEKQVKAGQKATALNFTDAVNEMPRPESFDQEDLSELETVVDFLGAVKKQAMEEVKQKHKPHIQGLLQKLGDEVTAEIEREYASVFEDKGNPIALGVAAVFLGHIKQYCVELTGWGQAGKEEETAVRMTSKAFEIKKRLESRYLDPNSPDLQAIARGEGGGIFSRTKVWRTKLLQAVDDIVQSCHDVAMYEALDDFYRRVLGNVDWLKEPIRFVQENVAKDLQQRMVRRASEELNLGKARGGAGLINYVCADQDSIEAIIKPKVKLFQSEEARRQEQDGILQEFIPRVKELVDQIRQLLKDWKGEPGVVLQNNRELYVGELRRHVDETVGRRIMADLEREASIADVLLAEAGMVKGLRGQQAVGEVESALISGYSGNIQVFSGFRPRVGNITPYEMKHLRINLDRFNRSMGNYIQRGDYDVRTTRAFTQSGFGMDKDLKDVFSFDVMIVRFGKPLFALKSLDRCHDQYDVYKEADNQGLHTDDRFAEDHSGDFDFKLPPVEMLGDADDDKIFLFLLAEQDWWKGLGTFDHQSEQYRGDIAPLITVQAKGKYMFTPPAGTYYAHGRENAQLKFIQDPKGIQSSMLALLKPRWNMGYTVQQRRNLLGELIDRKTKDRDDTDWAELIRCYENERRILQTRMDSGAFDL